MKRKGISFWEQNFERLVLGVAVLFFIGFTAWQFLSEPNAVENRPDGVVTPGQIDDLLDQAADRVQLGLAPGAAPAFELPDPIPVVSSFESALASGVSPAAMIAVSSPRAVLDEQLDTQVGVAFVNPVIPAPHSLVVQQDFAEILAEVVSAVPELAERFTERPYDVTWNMVGAIFDVADVRERFSTPGPNGEAPLPGSWSRNRVDVLDVRMERQERVNGVWTNDTKIDVLPAMFTFRDRLDGDVDKSVRDGILAELAEPGLQMQIVQPDFYATRNDAFSPPDPRLAPDEDDAQLGPEEKELRRWIRNVRKWTTDRDHKLSELEGLGGFMEEDPPEAPPEDPGEGEKTGGNTPGGRNPPGGDRRAPPSGQRKPPGGAAAPGAGLGSGGGSSGESAQKSKKIDSLKKAITRLNRRIADYTRKIEARQGAALEDRDDTDDEKELVIWAHDMNVEPGREYRYRFTVELYNPFYAKKLNLLPEQHGLADSITLSSTPSAWSSGFTPQPDRQVFITKAFGPGARNNGELKLGVATAEVYRFSHGRWWLERFTIQPGDRIGWTKAGDGPAEIDYGTHWVLLDVIDDIRASRQNQESGLGAQALLVPLDGDGDTIVADPVAAADDDVRLRLKDEVDLAETSEELASASPP